MDLRSDIELICSRNVEEVLNSPLLITMLKIYSILYLGGKQPNTCSKCHRDYYSQIINNGILKYNQMAENLKKTCELVSKDIIYLQPLHGHVSNVNMTDELAVRCIENKWLKESDFVKLPEGYKGKIKHPDILDESDLTVKKTRGKTNTEG